MAKHMDDKERGRIEFALDCGKSITQIARELGRPESTVSREIQNRRIDSEKRYGCSNRLCNRFDECDLTQFDGFSTRLRKNSARCFERCSRFFEACCARWAKAPYVCNGCEHEPYCPLRKKYYRAAGAQANYEGTLHASRLGVQMPPERFAEIDNVVSFGVKKGQSVSHIVASNPDLFKGVKPRTVYDWIDGGLLRAKRHDLPFACTRKPKPKKLEIKTNAKCRVGRTIQEMREWLKEHEGIVPCEIDTVIGSISGKVLFTMIFPDTGLALAFLRDAKTSQTCTRIFNMLWEIAGPNLFRTPIDLFVEKHGEPGRKLLAALGIRKIPGNQVTLHPFLLGQKFQRHADKVTLRKNGVTSTKKTESEK